MLSHRQMDSNTLLEGHFQATRERMTAAADKDLVFAQDTVYLNYSGQTDMEGLGAIQGNVLGIVQHNTLAVGGQSGLPLGLVYLRNWTRGGYQSWENESQKWFASLALLNELSASLPDKRLILVQDREADILALFKAPRAQNVHLLTRVCQARRYEILDPSTQGDHQRQVGHLREQARSLLPLGHTQVTIDRAGKPVTLTLEVAASVVRIWPNKILSVARHQTEPLSLVVAREIEAVDAQGQSVFASDQAAEWWLVTSMDASTLDQALEIIRYYALRWRVERLHYTLKSGALRVEKLQFDDVSTLCNALALYSLTAWRLLHVTYLARAQPQSQPEEAFSSQELEILQRAGKKPLHSLSDAVQALGRLVNFVPTKRQPLPGVKILAEGLAKLDILCQAWDLFNKSG